MKHDHAFAFRSFDEADAAALWPSGGELAASALAEVALPERAVPDMPAAVGTMLAGSYFALIGVCFATLAGSAEALFMVVVSGLYVLIYCGVPWIFLRVEADPTRRPTLSQFMRTGMATATGRISGAGALVQMLVVPVMLTFCLLAIGTMAGLYLNS
jgi:hypothetical protein